MTKREEEAIAGKATGRQRAASAARAMDRARDIARRLTAGKRGVTVDDFLADRRLET